MFGDFGRGIDEAQRTAEKDLDLSAGRDCKTGRLFDAIYIM